MTVSKFLIMATMLSLTGINHSSCRLQKNRKTGPNSGQLSEFFDRNSIVLSRNSTKTTAKLSFNILKSLNCSFEYWDKSNTKNIKKQNCAGEQKNQIRAEFSPLEPSSTIQIKVFLWELDQSQDKSKTFIVNEDVDNTPIDSLIITKIIVPQLSTEVYRHKLNKTTTISQLSSDLKKRGCQSTPNTGNDPLNNSTGNLELENFSTSGFATGPSTKHISQQDRLKQTFTFFELNQSWDFAFRDQSKEQTFSVRPPARISKLTITPNQVDIGSKAHRKLDKDPVTIKTSIDSDLQFEWSYKNLSQGNPANLIVDIRSEDGSKGLHCAFDPLDKSGAISAKDLKALQKGVYYFTVTLESHQLATKSDPNFTPWLIKSNDWRFAMLEI